MTVVAYNKESNFAKQISDESVLYLNEDKKKTRKWFQVCGNLNVPLEGTNFGVIRSISFQNKKDKRQFSLQDSDGNKLTPEQAEYFKDSKVRDKDGNLLVIYHGTPKILNNGEAVIIETV